MKLTELLLPAALLAALACNRTEPAPGPVQAADTGSTLTLNLEIPGIKTKGNSTYTASLSAENYIDNFQIMAFDVNGNNVTDLTSYTFFPEAEGETTFSTSILPGDKRMMALANFNTLSPAVLPNWSQRQNVVCDSKTWVTRSHLPLGKGFLEPWTMNIGPNKNAEVSIELKHLVSRIVLKSMYNEMEHEDYGVPKARKIALINVPNGMKITGDVVETPYYNPWGGDYSTLVGCTGGSATFRQLEYNGITLQPGILYAFPGANMYMLVEVEFTKGTVSTPYYYAVPLRNLAANHTYDVLLRLRNLGSTDPKNPTITYPSEFTVTVGSWTAGSTIDEMM